MIFTQWSTWKRTAIVGAIVLTGSIATMLSPASSAHAQVCNANNACTTNKSVLIDNHPICIIYIIGHKAIPSSISPSITCGNITINRNDANNGQGATGSDSSSYGYRPYEGWHSDTTWHRLHRKSHCVSKWLDDLPEDILSL